MTRRYKDTFRSKLLAYIEQMPDRVILRNEVETLGSPRQISRGLKALTEDGVLVKMGVGIYAKAKWSALIERPVICGGFTDACIDALQKLGVRWEPSQAHKDYNEGRSQQVPARFEVKLKSRFRRKLAYGKRTLRIEGMIYAK